MIVRAMGATLSALALLVFAAEIAAVQLSPRDGERLQIKIDAISKNGAADPPKPAQTAVSEPEANSYLAYNLKEKMPKGLTDPAITMIGEGALAARIIVDIDEVKRHRQSRGLVDPLNYLSGRLPLNARGVLRTRDGRGQFDLKSADINGVPLPRPIVQELVSYFSRTPQNPNGFNIDAPFELPARIREIAVKPGESVVIQ